MRSFFGLSLKAGGRGVSWLGAGRWWGICRRVLDLRRVVTAGGTFLRRVLAVGLCQGCLD